MSKSFSWQHCRNASITERKFETKINGEMEIHEDPKFEIIQRGNQAVKIRNGWMVKGGKKEPSTHSLYRLRGIKNMSPSQNPRKGGRWMAKEGRETIHRSQKITSRTKSFQ